MGSTALFGTVYGSHHIISANFYFYLQYFKQNKQISNTPKKKKKKTDHYDSQLYSDYTVKLNHFQESAYHL